MGLLSRLQVSYCNGMKTSPPTETSPRVILTTPRLVLRTTLERDIPVLQRRIFRDADVMRYAFAGVPLSDAHSDGFIRRFFTFGDSLTGIAVLTQKPDADAIGFAGLFTCDALGADDFEIGFVLAREVWGQGIATEIGAAQLAFGFDRLNCRRLLGLVDRRNAASIHALTKLGMRYVKDVIDPKRAPRSVYIIDAATWRARR